MICFSLQIRELYALCVSSSIVESPQYKQCMLLIGFQSKEDFLDVLDKTISQFDSIPKCQVATPKKRRLSLSSRKTLDTNIPTNSAIKKMSAVKERLVLFKEKIKNASLDCDSIKEEDETEQIIEKLNRQNLREVFSSTFYNNLSMILQ